MVENEAPSYEELKCRLDLVESSIRAIRNGQIDAILGKDQTLIVRLFKTEERAAHIKNILLAVRRVHQIIIRENNPGKLIQNACNTLTDTLGYCSALISLLDESDIAVTTTIASGFDKYESGRVQDYLSGGCPCVKTTPVYKNGMVDNILCKCSVCPLISAISDRSVLSHPLRFGGKTYGIICVSLEPSLSDDPEVRTLFTDVADDIAFALNKIKEAEKLAQTQVELQITNNEKKQLQDELFNARKLESIGRLAGGVAHDYNNMMSVILGHTELAMDIIAPDNPILEHLDPIMDAAKRLTKITRQLLTFARKQMIRPEVLDLNSNLEKMLALLKSLIGENIDLEWISNQVLWHIKLDPSQIDQILTNLCANSRDAIGDRRGIITIQTDNVTVDNSHCAKHAELCAGEFVVLTVKDNGCGIDKEIIDNVFEPFFTTKGVGQGTGLGLATVYGIVKQNNGFIQVESKKDKGTVFKIYIPKYNNDSRCSASAP